MQMGRFRLGMNLFKEFSTDLSICFRTYEFISASSLMKEQSEDCFLQKSILE